MARAGGSGDFGSKLQDWVEAISDRSGVPLNQTAGSGNVFVSDSDLGNRLMQIECKGKTSKDGVSMPAKADWKKLIKEADGASRMPMLITSGNKMMMRDALVTLHYRDLLYLMQGVKDEL